jgi:hypothetical protein
MTGYLKDYMNQSAQKKGGIWTFYDGLVTTGALTLLRSDVPSQNVQALPIPPATFVLKIVASAPSGHTDCAGTVTVNAEVITFTVAATKYTVTGLTTIPTISTSALDCKLVITAYDPVSTTDIYEWFTAPCRWENNQIGYWTSAGAWSMSNSVVISETNYIVGNTLRLVGGSDVYGQLVKSIIVFLDQDGVEQGRRYLI